MELNINVIYKIETQNISAEERDQHKIMYP